MSLGFNRVTLPHTHLVQVMGKSPEEVQSELHKYLDQNAVSDFEVYTFDMVIKQGGVRNVLYVGYASIPAGLKSVGQSKVISLSNNKFIECEIPISNYEDFLDGKFNDEMTEYKKDNQLKDDMSSVFALFQKNDNVVRVLIPYK
ncbi:hypothetical protein [Paracholeplasma manati]|uniref:hypothetical protein n=1 Tax=Paracholeplasma manati TaxID=591373 RepID=UPI0024087CAF|nr:hypothetical protein [Paracholeplasma manati]MDG0888185.1 hypothetical protein [Paracholeplasma manati]